MQKGDAVVTSGIDGIYPEGFVVGLVEHIEQAGGLYRSVRVRPAVDFSALEHVLVVTAPAFVGPRSARGPIRRRPAPRIRRGGDGGDEAMSALRVAAFVFAALVLQTTLARYLVRGSVGVDLVLVVVIYLSLRSGPTVGMLTGTVAGLMQDSLMTGIVGIGSLGKTLVGYLAGIVGRAFIVTQPVPRFLVFFAATLLEMTVIAALRAIVNPGPASGAGRRDRRAGLRQLAGGHRAVSADGDGDEGGGTAQGE